MLIDWAIYFAAVWGLVFTLNKTLFKDRAPSSFVKWSLTVVLFLSSLVALSVIKYFRYKYISQIMGFNISPLNPFDSGGALIGSFLFFRLLGKGKLTVTATGARPLKQQERVEPTASADDRASLTDVPGDAPINDAIYEKIDQEINTNNFDRAIWTRAQGDADGNAERAKSLYIKYRAQRLLAISRDESAHQSPADAVSVEKPPSKNTSFFAMGNAVFLVLLVATVIVIAFYAWRNITQSQPEFSGQEAIIPQAGGPRTSETFSYEEANTPVPQTGGPLTSTPQRQLPFESKALRADTASESAFAKLEFKQALDMVKKAEASAKARGEPNPEGSRRIERIERECHDSRCIVDVMTGRR